jgi:hypothetical protein
MTLTSRASPLLPSKPGRASRLGRGHTFSRLYVGCMVVLKVRTPQPNNASALVDFYGRRQMFSETLHAELLRHAARAADSAGPGDTSGSLPTIR